MSVMLGRREKKFGKFWEVSLIPDVVPLNVVVMRLYVTANEVIKPISNIGARISGGKKS